MIDLARWRPMPLRRVMTAAAFAVVVAMAAAPQATAQSNIDLSTDNVTVDLSVIEGMGGPGAKQPPYVTGGPASGGPQVPGPRAPVSALHVAVPRGGDSGHIKLRPPGTKKTVQKKKAAKPAVARKKPSPPPAPRAAPTEPKIAAPAPPAMPKTAVAEAPAPPPPAEPAPAKAPETKHASSTPPPAPVPAAPPAARPAKAEQAAVTTQALATGRAMRVQFQAAASKLPDDSKGGLKTLAEKLKGQDAVRVQLMAYAGGSGVSASKARRMSLSRALSVRSFLIENGVRSTRIDVRALGSKTSEEPLNRVDVNIVER